MSPAILTAFAASFLLGPALAAALWRLPAAGGVLTALAGATLAALALARFGPAGWLQLAALWLAWVLAVVFAALALRRRAPAGAARWLGIGAMIATTLPWFGLTLAEMTKGS
ncbi:hypothetical protein [Roseivivax sp. CAU 1761]